MRSATSNTSDGPPPRDPRADPDLSHLASSWLHCWMGALGLVLLEFTFLLFSGANVLTGVWELQMSVFGLLPAWACLTLGPAAAATWTNYIFGRARLTHRARVTLALGSLVFGSALGWGVGGGRHLAAHDARLAFAAAVGFVGGALTFWMLPRVHELMRRLAHAPWLEITLLGTLVLGIELVNSLVLVRLYPAFHLGLSFLACMVSGMGTGRVLDRINIANVLHLNKLVRGRLHSVFLLILLVVSGAALVPASHVLAHFDNARFLVSQGPPTVAWGGELAARIAPPPRLDPEALALPLGATRPMPRSGLRFNGRTILLISVDALRADHLGCYGYGRPTSPAMDRLAREGVRFNAAYAPTPHTSYSVTSLMTGKYMRPLLLQGAGEDSELWATLLQTFGYRTAAFYPPAVFFIDPTKFAAFQDKRLGFEYAKVEFAEGEKRLSQVQSYVTQAASDHPLFLWIHLFGPHEPYVKHAAHDFGDKDIDRYDSEIRAADESVAGLVQLVRAHDPNALVILTADHGEEFGDHGGRYHGTSVYDEQVRVPLVIAGPGLAQGRVVSEPVQTIDLLPTLLEGLDILVPPRIRGRSLLSFLGPTQDGLPSSAGLAVAETDEFTLLAEGSERLICHRRSGACRLFDTEIDPKQLQNLSEARPERTRAMKDRARAIAETHGRYETQGLRAGGRGWPKPIVLGISGNAEVVPELALLLDDADVEVRRKAAELLFELAQEGQAPAIRLALGREEDQAVRAYLALTLTRLGEGAPLVVELLSSSDLGLRRKAALVLAQTGNDLGEQELIRWFMDVDRRPHESAIALLEALGRIRSKSAVPVLLDQLKDVRLRPAIAAALAAIGTREARGPLTEVLRAERFHSARAPLAEAILQLGGRDELVLPLRHFLAVPDPMSNGLEIALRAKILDQVGGPKMRDLERLRQLGSSGVRVSMIVPPLPKTEQTHPAAVRLLVLLRSRSGNAAQLLVQPGQAQWSTKRSFSKQPEIDSETAVVIPWVAEEGETESTPAFRQISVELPARFSFRPGGLATLDLYATGDLEVSAVAIVPRREELPPPPPAPWTKPSDVAPSSAP